MSRARRWFRISEVAERYELHAQTLRLWERKGLLRPARSRGGARWYAREDLERLESILVLSRDLGVNLAGIEVVLHMRERMQELLDEVEALRRALDAGRATQSSGAGTALVALGPRRIVPAARRRAS